MTHLLLSSSGEWTEMFLTIIGLFGFIFLIFLIYNKVAEKTKIDGDSAGCLWPLVLAVSLAILFGIKNCKGCKGTSGGGASDEYWENTPRHTQIQKPMQNNVNAFIFPLS